MADIPVVSVLPTPAVVGDSVVLNSTSELYVWNGFSWVKQGEGRAQYKRNYDKRITIVDEIPNSPPTGYTVYLSTNATIYVFNGVEWVAGGAGGGGSPYIPLPSTWIELATGWSTEPTLESTLTDGDVYKYVYSDGTTYYRYIANDGSEDSFYELFDGINLSSLVADKQIIPL